MRKLYPYKDILSLFLLIGLLSPIFSAFLYPSTVNQTDTKNAFNTQPYSFSMQANVPNGATIQKPVERLDESSVNWLVSSGCFFIKKLNDNFKASFYYYFIYFCYLMLFLLIIIFWNQKKDGKKGILFPLYTNKKGGLKLV